MMVMLFNFRFSERLRITYLNASLTGSSVSLVRFNCRKCSELFLYNLLAGCSSCQPYACCNALMVGT